ncbi:sulfurtransferase [Streptomyces sp. NPDC093085]|uniref:sulfurtransferase n=1 Tax=Streptomyces sp. NPDC093085 TaxID=3155068 RepID=UPI003429176E
MPVHATTPPPLTGPRVLTTVTELAALLGSAAPPVVLDVRWALGDPHGRTHYRAAHIPGAVYADLETELAAPATPHGGRHPLPGLAVLQAAARRWGLTAGRPVVVHDDNGNTAAARAWWLLRWAGVADVTLLDGALGAWRAAGLPLEDGEVVPAPGDITLGAGHLPTVDAGEAAELARTGTLLDARAAERYRGESEPVDPRAGHIPGARSAPTGENLAADGTFLPPAALRARFAALGIGTTDGGGDGDGGTDESGGLARTGGGGPVAVYCGSGVTAAHQIAALALAGTEAALFPGSWSAWSADPARPAATGRQPG